MKHAIAILILSFSLVKCSFASSELLRVSRVEHGDNIQLFFSFDKTPQFTENGNGKRINLIFSDTRAVPRLKYFGPDSRIVKILPHADKDSFILSIFFRYKPQRYTFSKSSDGKIVFEVLSGNRYSKSYKDLADRLKGLTILERNSAEFPNPYKLSPYSKNWLSFFSDYESPVRIDVSVQFNFPPFPLFQFLPPENADNRHVLSKEMYELAQNGQWARLADLLLEKLNSNPEIINHKLLALTYGEVLARDNSFEEGLKQLDLINKKYQGEPAGYLSRYMIALTEAVQGDPYLANIKFDELEDEISTINPLAPYLLLSQIETALAAGQYPRMNKLLLRDDMGFPVQVEEIKNIRQADYWYAINQPIKAYTAYNLLSSHQLLNKQPYSLNGYCSSLYSGKKYNDSAECYNQLLSLKVSQKNSGLISYREKMSELKYEKESSLIYDFSQIENKFSGSEPGFRAALKKSDLLLQDKNQYDMSLHQFTTIAEQSIQRPIREEALFKQALTLSLLGQNSSSITILQKILREFREQGEIRMAELALLVKLLPEEIRRRVDKKEYAEVLVLARQHRELFKKGWIDPAFLMDIAAAYQHIGIFGEAQKLYLYLIETVPVDKKEQYYLPMIEACLNNGNYGLVDEYAAQYSYNYPHGTYSDQILFRRLQALVAYESFTEALNLVPTPLPRHNGICSIAAALFYQKDNYRKSSELYELLSQSDYSFSESDLIMYGESLFQTGHYDQAENVYLQIDGNSPFFNQSLYRLSEIERRKGDEENSLRFLGKIVDTGNKDLWQRYALEELQYAETTAYIKSISPAIQMTPVIETAENRD